MWGHIFKQQGRKVIAPPVEGRGFSKLEKLNLQYLYWDLTQEIPPDEYRDLIQNALLAVQKIEPDGKTFEELMREIKRLGINLGDPTTPVPKVEKDPNAFPIRPKGTSTTGQVWELADTEFEKAGNQMPNRAAVIAACEAAGINGSTAATQYAKWKKAKGI
jgi:hypothetical protein